MKNIYKIIKLAKPYHGWIALASLVITVNAALTQATPLTLRYVVDELSNQITSGTGDFTKILYLFGLILLFNVSGVLLSTVNQRIGDHIASRLGRYLTEKYYTKIFTLPQSYFDSEISGKIVNQLSRGINSIKEFIGAATNFIVPALLQALFGISILFYYDRLIGLLALFIFPFYIAIANYSTKQWGEKQQKKNVLEDASRGRIQEVISNIKLVKTYNTQKSEYSFVSDKYKKLNKIYDTQSVQYHILNFLREFGLELTFVVILFVIFRKTFMGDLTLGEMILIIQLMSQLRWPLYGMSFILERVQGAEADSKAYFDVMDIDESEEFVTKKLKKPIDTPEIEFENVSFSYNESKQEVLHNVSFSLDGKATVALVGHSGSGKTTLINLILKLYEPTKGEILISGKKYSKLDHSWVRSHVSLVFQDNELFSSTIRENVAYGIKNAKDKDIIAALKKANAYDFVKKLKDGLDTKIGERGVKLSGGQKQRIQIARAILHDKAILILDEATSSLDSKSEMLVQDALENLFKDKLVIIIAHRFSTIQNVDKIVVIDKGSVVDSGTPGELASKKGIYSELLKYQIEGNKKLLSKYELA